MHKIKLSLIAKGYKYLSLENVQSADSGATIFHYMLLPEFVSCVAPPGSILLDSQEGEHVIMEAIAGRAAIHLYVSLSMRVTHAGRLYHNYTIKTFKFYQE